MIAEVVCLCRSIEHEVGLKALREALHKRDEKTISVEEFFKMAEFVLKSNYFEFSHNIKQKTSSNCNWD